MYGENVVEFIYYSRQGKNGLHPSSSDMVFALFEGPRLYESRCCRLENSWFQGSDSYTLLGKLWAVCLKYIFLAVSFRLSGITLNSASVGSCRILSIENLKETLHLGHSHNNGWDWQLLFHIFHISSWHFWCSEKSSYYFLFKIPSMKSQ